MEVGPDLVLGVEPLRQLAHRQPVPHGDCRPAHEAGVMQVKERPFDGVAAERVGAVEHDHGDSCRSTRLQARHHRPGERVDPRTDVLQIDDQALQPLEHRRRGLSRLAVKAVDRHAEHFVSAVPGFDHVFLLLTPESVLRREQRGEPPGKPAGEKRRGVFEFLVHRRLVRKQSEPRRVAKHLRRRLQAVLQSGRHAGHGIGRSDKAKSNMRHASCRAILRAHDRAGNCPSG